MGRVGCYDALDIERALHQGKDLVVVTVSSEDRVRAAFAEGQRVWPGVGLTAEAFAAYLARVEADAELLAARAADLFIAAACAQGDDLAIRQFDATYLAPIERYVARLHLRPEQLGELRQQLRLSILLGSAPLVGRYRGSGPLAAWVRVVVVRNALELARADQAAQQANDVEALDRLIAPELGPEAHAIKSRYRERLQLALEEALSALSVEDKTLLRLHFVDGLSAEAIGRIYAVHRATVARWLIALRRQMLQRVRHGLALPATATSSELRSLLTLLRSEIELSLRSILR
jgi:RNA polymerase sigma-70 factor, ECF subfamily